MVDKSTLLANDASESLSELIMLLGKQVTYKRFSTQDGDPDSGYEKTFWETPSFDALVLGVDSYAAATDSRLEQNFRKLIFRTSEFKSRGDDDEAEPRSGDEITINGDVWKTDLGEGEAVWKKDDTEALFKVYIKKER